MASTGEKFPTAAQTINESPWLDEPWVNPNNALTNDGNNAAVTATTYDTGDQTAVLKLYTYDMSSIPVGATITGVTVRIHARGDSTSVRLDLVQLLDTARAKVGTNKASTVVPMTASLAVYTFGGSTDLWGNALTRAWVQDADFGVAIGCHANTNNSEAYVNYATIEVHYDFVDAGTVYVDITPSATEAKVTPPNAPTLVAPTDDSSFDPTATKLFDWTFSHPVGGESQTAWALRRRIASYSVGPNSPTTASLVAAGDGSTHWADPDNVFTSDSAEASVPGLPELGRSHSLLTSGYGFSIPSDVTIRGIIVQLEARNNGLDNEATISACLLTLDGSDLHNPSMGFVWLTAAEAVRPVPPTSAPGGIYGKISLWELFSTITPAVINDTGFGVRIQADGEGTSRDPRVDHIGIKVFLEYDWEWWDATLEEWSSTEVFNTGTTESYTFDANTWDADTYEWSVSTKDELNEAGPYAEPFTVTATASAEYTDSGTVTLDIQVSSFDLYKGSPSVRGSFFFDGNMSYETAPVGSTIDRPYTVGVWIKPLWLPTMTVQAPASLGRNGAGAEGALPLLSSPTTGAAYEEYNSDFETVNAGGAFTDGAWNSLAAVFTSHSSRKAFVNGNTSGSTGTGAMTTPIPDHNRIYLGKFPDGSWDFRGWIAYLFVWEYALSDAEITAWHAGDLIRDSSRGASYFWDLTLPPSAIPGFEFEDWWNASVLSPIGADALVDTGNAPPVIYQIPDFDSGTVYFDITPSGTEFKETGGAGTEYTDSNTVPLVITPVGVEVRDRADATTVPVTLTPSAIELREFTDANTVYVDLQLSAVELREFTDANTVYVDLQVSSTEIREFTDAATVLLDIQLSSTDLAEFADTGTVYVDLQNSATELRESADATTVTLVLTPSATEFITRETLDSGTVSVVLTPSAVEVRDRVDAATVSIALTPSAVEIREFTDANTIYVDLQTSSTELRESADANTVYLDLQVSDVQVFEAVDSGTVYFDIQPAGVDEHVPSGGVEYLDSGTVLVDLQLSSTEVRDSADNNTVAVALTPSSVELREITDAATVYVDVVPSSVEIREVTDSNTIYVDLQLSSVETRERADTGLVPLVITPLSTDTAAYVETGTVYYDITPYGVEYLQGVDLPYDTYLTAVMSRPWSGTMTGGFYAGSLRDRQYSATMTQKFTGVLGGLRFSGALGNSMYSGALSKLWSGILGRK